MKNESYSVTISVPVKREQAFDAVANRISEWWGKDLEGGSARLNDVFTIHFGKTFGKFEISDCDPPKKIVWNCIDNYLDIFNDKTQWKGTRLIWEFSDAPGGASIQFTHDGLIPIIECYSDCIKGWDFYLKESLYGLLANGKGMPGVGIRANIEIEGQLYEGTMYAKEDAVPEFPPGQIWGDIKVRNGERVVSFYSIRELNEDFNPTKIKGTYYFVIENRDSTLIDLGKAVN